MSISQDFYVHAHSSTCQARVRRYGRVCPRRSDRVCPGPTPAKPAAGTTAKPAPKPNAEGWPREEKLGKSTFVIYQPRLISWGGGTAVARSAVSVTDEGDEQGVSYGVVEFTAITGVDRGTRMVYPRNVDVKSVNFPAAPEREQQLVQAIKNRRRKS